MSRLSHADRHRARAHGHRGNRRHERQNGGDSRRGRQRDAEPRDLLRIDDVDRTVAGHVALRGDGRGISDGKSDAVTRDLLRIDDVRDVVRIHIAPPAKRRDAHIEVSCPKRRKDVGAELVAGRKGDDLHARSTGGGRGRKEEIHDGRGVRRAGCVEERELRAAALDVDRRGAE